MIRNTHTLLVDCTIKYLPDEVVRFHIFEKLLKNDKNKKYVTLSFKDMLIPHGLAILKEKSVFRKRLYAMKNCNRYLLLKLVAMLAGVLMAIGKLILELIRSFRINKDKEYFAFFLSSAAAGVQIGDCVLSLVLRTEGSKGFLVRDFHFYKTWIKFLFNFYSTVMFSRVLAWLYTGNKYFYSHETTYLDEAVRRILLKIGFNEIRYDFFQHESIVMPSLYGYEIRNREYGRLHLDESKFELEKAEKKLRDLVYRNETYSYMLTSDVHLGTRLDNSDLVNWSEQRVAIIYLHAVSDAQFFYGVDCFIDLHDWLMETLALLEKCGVNACVKMHPAYYSVMLNYPVDKKYLKTLEEIFGISIDQISPGKPTITNRPNVCFLHHSLSILELSRVFPSFLCITHHGTVATEAAYLGHAVVCSTASTYMKNKDRFVFIYETFNEYESYIQEWKINGATQDASQFKALLAYIYINFFVIKPENIALVLSKAIGLNLSTLDHSSFNKAMEQALTCITVEDELFNKIESAVKEYV